MLASLKNPGAAEALKKLEVANCTEDEEKSSTSTESQRAAYWTDLHRRQAELTKRREEQKAKWRILGRVWRRKRGRRRRLRGTWWWVGRQTEACKRETSRAGLGGKEDARAKDVEGDSED